MNLKRISLYALYLLPIIGGLGKVVGWVTLSNSFFTQWFSEGLILLFLVLQAKSLYKRFNPGVNMLRHAVSEEILLDLEVQKGWFLIGIGIRLFFVVVLSILGLLMLKFYTPEYIYCAMFFLFVGILVAGIFHYLKYNPYRILITESGVRSYIFKFFEFDWGDMKEIAEKDRWVVFRSEGKAFRDVEYEDLVDPPTDLLAELKTRSIVNGFLFKNERLKPEYQ